MFACLFCTCVFFLGAATVTYVCLQRAWGWSRISPCSITWPVLGSTPAIVNRGWMDGWMDDTSYKQLTCIMFSSSHLRRPENNIKLSLFWLVSMLLGLKQDEWPWKACRAKSIREQLIIWTYIYIYFFFLKNLQSFINPFLRPMWPTVPCYLHAHHAAVCQSQSEGLFVCLLI